MWVGRYATRPLSIGADDDDDDDEDEMGNGDGGRRHTWGKMLGFTTNRSSSFGGGGCGAPLNAAAMELILRLERGLIAGGRMESDDLWETMQDMAFGDSTAR